MPLYEYECEQCHQQFELLVRAIEDNQCPECGSPELNRLLSTTAKSVSNSASLPITGGCPPSDAPPCSPGCCRL